MYRTVDAAFWSDPKINSLDPKGKLLALYLVTNPHSHVGGIYYLPEPVVMHETGLSKRELDTLWDTLSGAGFSRIDKKTSVVWVRKMFFYQGRGEKNEKSVASHLRSLHNSCLVNEFLHAYPTVAKWVSDRVSIGYPAQDFLRTPEQDQEKEQDKDQNQDKDSCSEPSSEPMTPYVYPVNGNKFVPTWTMPAALLAVLQESYPGINHDDEARKAMAWCVTNPSKRKTAGGMPKFLNGWFERAQNALGGNGNGQRQQQQPAIRGLKFGDGQLADSL